MPDIRQLRRNPAIEEAPLQEEMMLFDAVKSKFFVLNPAMALTWTWCDGTHSVAEISEELASRFGGVTPDEARGDVERAVAELYELGLLLDVR
ncbi:MAG TPA: PqqD family protein [Thermoanaerobaculia bacterium]|nr:PqqD family protein [Thermoanaerobaculia bacterium]